MGYTPKLSEALCLVCGNKLNLDEEFRYSQTSGIDICDHCAGVAAVGYEKWHGGGREHTGKDRKILSQKVRWDVFKRDEYRCRHCGSEHDLTIDHIEPKSLGGMDDDGNLQTLCRPCNSKKGVSV